MPRDVPVRPEGRRTMLRYLKAREEEIASRPARKGAPAVRALFPALEDLGDGYFSPNSLGRLKRIVEEGVGSRFELRACRRTFGQGCIDEGMPVETVSLLLGHATSKTTESYYCRKRQDAAIREAQAFLGRPPGDRRKPEN